MILNTFHSCYMHWLLAVKMDTYLAMSVFPVPGGPYRRIPRGGYNSQDKIKGQAFLKYLCNSVLSTNLDCK